MKRMCTRSYLLLRPNVLDEGKDELELEFDKRGPMGWQDKDSYGIPMGHAKV